jgi:hypothetical protein
LGDGHQLAVVYVVDFVGIYGITYAHVCYCTPRHAVAQRSVCVKPVAPKKIITFVFFSLRA